MENEGKGTAKNIYDRVLSKLKNELNSEISTLINVDVVRDKIACVVDGRQEEEIFDMVYPYIYKTALQNLTENIFIEDQSFSNGSTKTCKNLCASQAIQKDHTINGFPQNMPNSFHKSLVEVNQPNLELQVSDVHNVHCGNVSNFTKIADTFCSILPNLNKKEIEIKLKDHSHISGYKAILLQESISSSVEQGFDISDLAFSKLEEWCKDDCTTESETADSQRGSSEALLLAEIPNKCSQNKPKVVLPTNSDQQSEDENCKEVPNFDIIQFDDKIKFVSEIVPGVSEESLKNEIKCCLTKNEANAVISRYMKYFDSNDSSFNHGISGSQTGGSISGIISLSDSEKDNYIISNEENDKGCIIVGEKKCKTPPLISLDEEASSPASNNSDILVVEELVAKPKDNANVDHQEVGLNLCSINEFVERCVNKPDKTSENCYSEQPEVRSTATNKEESSKNDYSPNHPEILHNSEDIEMDVMPWNEAQEICTLLPFLQLNNIHQSIMDNYYHPNRKAEVLKEYVELALEEGYDVKPEVLETVLYWQSARKRPLTDEKEGYHNGSYKRQKHHAHSSFQPDMQEPLPSTSRERVVIDIPVEQPLPAEGVGNNKQKGVETLFNSFSEETKQWYQKKVDFMKEVIHGLSEEYILSKIIHCQTEADILHVAGMLLEEQTANILHSYTSESDENAQEEGNSRSVQNDEVIGTVEQVESEETSLEQASSSSVSNSDVSNTNQVSAADTEDRIQAHIQQIGEIFPDADPDFLCERANEIAGDNNKFVELVVELTENRSYPKMEDYLKKQKKLDMRKKFIEGMDVKEFLEYFEDPEKVFMNTLTEMNLLYKKNAKAQLMKDLPFHLSRVIDTVFQINNYHYLPTLRELRSLKGLRKSKRTTRGPQPADMDDVFIKELCYARLEKEIKDHHHEKALAKERAFQKAKEEGQLVECHCCCDDEVLFEDTSACDSPTDSHFFCNNCVKRYSEEQIGQGRLEFMCLEGECKAQFSLNTLKPLLRPSVFSNLLKRKQAEEIAAAGIEDLESCPFCNFVTIMPNKDDRVFKCLNPECLKDSCRLCRELNHVPLRCEEVEKKKQTDARTFLENEMSEAIVRECYKCKRRFIKDEGCNKMICSCGAMMCYLCKKPIKGYDHFTENSRSAITKGDSSKCPLWTNSLELHPEEVRKRAEEAKEKLDPEVDLLHDPTKDLPQVPEYLRLKSNAHANVQQNLINAAAIAVRRQVEIHQPQEQLAGMYLFGNAMADRLPRDIRPSVQRHSHQHNHQHYYYNPHPPAHLPLPSQSIRRELLRQPPPAHLPQPPPAHLPQLANHRPPDIVPPPPAHHPQQLPLLHQPRPPPFIGARAHVDPHAARNFMLHRPAQPQQLPQTTIAFVPQPAHHQQRAPAMTYQVVPGGFCPTTINLQMNPQQRPNPPEQYNHNNNSVDDHLLPPYDRHQGHNNHRN